MKFMNKTLKSTLMQFKNKSSSNQRVYNLRTNQVQIKAYAIQEPSLAGNGTKRLLACNSGVAKLNKSFP